MLEGLLVNLVPYGKDFHDREHTWSNNESMFWASGGNRLVASQAALAARRERRAERRASRPNRRMMFGIRTKTGMLIGNFSLKNIDPASRLAALGAMIGEPDYWGGGYGTDALLLAVDYAFDWLDLRKLWLETSGFNARVHRQMQKVGFTLEVCQRRAIFADGAWYDGLLFGLLRTEWPGRAAMIEKLGLQAVEE